MYNTCICSMCLTLHAKGLRIRLIFLISPGCIALINLKMRAKMKDQAVHKLVSSSGFMHGNEIVHDQTALSGPESKRHLLAEECTILKKLSVALLLLHTPCALLTMREQTVGEHEQQKEGNEQATMMNKTNREKISCHCLMLGKLYYIIIQLEGKGFSLLVSLQSTP